LTTFLKKIVLLFSLQNPFNILEKYPLINSPFSFSINELTIFLFN